MSDKLDRLLDKLIENKTINYRDLSEINNTPLDFFTEVKKFICKGGYSDSAMTGELKYDINEGMKTPWTTFELIDDYQGNGGMEEGFDVYAVYKFNDIYVKFSGRQGSWEITECNSIEQVFPKKIEKTIFEPTKG